MSEPSVREMSFKPPICPKCRQALEVVDEKSYDKYVFNREMGRYIFLPRLSDCDLSCSKCGEILPYELFPDGVCNYFAEDNPYISAQARS